MPIDAYLLYVNDVGSFEELYYREYPNLVAVARALTGDRRDAEDLVQDTMVKAFIHWARLSRYGKPGAWCHRVLTRACRDHWQRRRTRERYLNAQRVGEPTVDGPALEFIAFWAAVRRLPERPRLVVTLYYAGDRSVAEVAAIVGVPEGTVKSDLSRARIALRTDLGED